MKISLVVVGKTDQKYVKEGFDVFYKRVSRYVPIEYIELTDVKNAASLSRELLKQKEGELILAKAAGADFLVLLDENGRELPSVEFAHFLEDRMNQSVRNLMFVIGGAYGFSEAVYQQARAKLSLSKMTFSHQLIRLIFVEQLYRGFTIIRGEPYHHV